MKVLFLTLYRIKSINNAGIYEDLLHEFAENGHQVYILTPSERRYLEQTSIKQEKNCKILNVQTGNIQKTNIIEKGISTICLEKQFIKAIEKYFSNVKFDLVMYSTPPITLAGVVEYIKKRDNAKSYLLLKDIFPQNAVDIGMMQKNGVRGLVYRWFRRKEKQLYALSDYIGCMSQANVEYLLKHNPEIEYSRVWISPNCINPRDVLLTVEERINIRNKYGIPLEKKIFVYGGNLGRPQGIPFLIECIRSQKNNDEFFFLIVGDGTEYAKLESFMNDEKPQNMKLMKHIPKEDYDRMVAACDVGMIFLDHRFTIPNFPSRLLTYMQAKLPVLAVTDKNTDVGKSISEGKFGWWCESNNLIEFIKVINSIQECDLEKMGRCGFEELKMKYTAKSTYESIQNTIGCK